jgi:hypothetical protein
MVWDIWRLVRHRLALLGIVVLWLDEAHDLFRSRSAHEIRETLKTIKTLMQGETAVIVVLSGTRRLSKITSVDAQVDRRFSKVVPRDLKHGADNGDLERVVRSYCEIAGLHVRLEQNLTGRLIHGSRARFGRAIETLINAIECAMNSQEDTLTIAHFAEAWGGQEGCSQDRNVFVCPDWLSLVLEEEDEDEIFGPDGIKRQRNGQGRR